jgi:hypothetical protein
LVLLIQLVEASPLSECQELLTCSQEGRKEGEEGIMDAVPCFKDCVLTWSQEGRKEGEEGIMDAVPCFKDCVLTCSQEGRKEGEEGISHHTSHHLMNFVQHNQLLFGSLKFVCNKVLWYFFPLFTFSETFIYVITLPNIAGIMLLHAHTHMHTLSHPFTPYF